MRLFDTSKTELNIERRISPTKMIPGVFIIIIFIGTFLLMLPISSRSGIPCDFMTALFTATSATCVTGLSVVDTLAYWTPLGQLVILLLIQCGGLGFMVFATLFSLAVHRRISLRERLIMTQTFSVEEISGVVRLSQNILVRTLALEGVGAAVLSFRFIPEYGFERGLFKSIFHSVSAFCNAGFDIIGTGADHSGSMSKYAGDPVVCLTLITLMILGGLGFFVWEDIRKKKRFHAFNLHTKLVITATAALLLSGTVLFMLFEYNNVGTFGGMGFGEKLLSSLFQSSTTRTAGFYTFSQNEMTVSSKLLSALLMFVGGSPGSTAGGIKTVTFAVLILTAVSVMRGKEEVTAFERKISPFAVLKAVAVSMVAFGLVFVSTIIISQTNGVSVIDSMFESVSAFSTTGLSTGITSQLNSASKLILILLMYFGRVGLLTISIGLISGRKPSKIRCPEGRIIIG